MSSAICLDFMLLDFECTNTMCESEQHIPLGPVKPIFMQDNRDECEDGNQRHHSCVEYDCRQQKNTITRKNDVKTGSMSEKRKKKV